MRTNIEIDDELMKQAQKVSGGATKKAVVEEALQLLVRAEKQRVALESLWGLLKHPDDWVGAPEGKDKWAEAEVRRAEAAKSRRKAAA